MRTQMTSECGRRFLMGVVARVLLEEQEDLFSFVEQPELRRSRRLFPDGPCNRLLEEMEPERWDGLA